MKTINLKHIRTVSGIRASVLADKLFPNHKYPYKALNYVEQGKNFLDSNQIVMLSEMLKVPVGLLFDDAEWQMGVRPGSNKKVVQFKTYDYFAELDYETMTTTIAKNGELLTETLVHPYGVELTKYLSDLTDLIIKNTGNEQHN